MTNLAIERAAILSTLFHSGLVKRKQEVTDADSGETKQIFAPLYTDGDAHSVTANKDTDKFAKNGHGMANGTRGRFTAATLPTGISGEIDYFVVNKGTNDFQVATTVGGTPVNFTSNGTAVVFTVKIAVGSIRCALSLSNGSAVQTEAERKITKSPVLFTMFDEDVRIGDHVTVTLEDASTVEIVVDSLSKYPTHLEAAASLRDEARA